MRWIEDTTGTRFRRSSDPVQDSRRQGGRVGVRSQTPSATRGPTLPDASRSQLCENCMADAPFLSPHPRALAPSDIVLGAIWIAPGGGEQGDGTRGDPGQDNATATVSAAIAHGVREFDTAPWYGAGASEERLGGAIAALSEEQRQPLQVGTKAGRLRATRHDFNTSLVQDSAVAYHPVGSTPRRTAARRLAGTHVVVNTAVVAYSCGSRCFNVHVLPLNLPGNRLRRPVHLAATFMRCGLASAQTTTRRPARAAPSPPRSPALVR